MNSLKIAAALRVLALAFEAPEDGALEQPAPAAEPVKRGRGRPAKGEESAASAPAQASSTPPTTPAAAEVDPFETAAPAAPTATLEEVRESLKGLAAVSSQATALDILKTVGGAANLTALTADKYGEVVQAAKIKANTYAKDPTPEVDPFEVPVGTPTAAEVKPVTLEDVKALLVATQKRTSQDTVQKIVMKHGGKAALPTGGEGPSLKALPESAFAAVVAELKALPATK